MDHDSADSFNDGFVQMMYETFLSNPDSVSDEWKTMFANGPTPNGSVKAANGTGTAEVARPAATAAGAAPAASSSPTGSAKPAPTGSGGTTPDEAKLLRGPAAGLVKNMNESLTVPTATTIRTISVAALDAQRKRLNGVLSQHGRKLSFTHIIAWALVLAAREFPVMAHTFEVIDGKPHLMANSSANLGIAVDVEKPDGSRGLMVPCIHGAQAMDARTFLDRYDALIAAARGGKLKIDDMMGTNITLTNPGGLGTVASVPRLMAHQGTIIATGSIAYPVEFQHLNADQLAAIGVSKVMTMTSTYDHRVIQGAESGSYLRLVDQLLQGGHDFYDQLEAALTGDAPAAAAPAEPEVPVEVTRTEDGTVTPPPLRADMARTLVDAMEVAEGGSATTQFARLDTAVVTTGSDQLASVAAAMALVKAHRTHGHLAATLDPLGTPAPGDPSLQPGRLGLTDQIMGTIPASVLRIGVEGETLADALPKLREKYCGTIAYEIEHISSHDQRVWLRRMIESGEHRKPLTAENRQALLQRLMDVEVFERFIRRAYLAAKQFSIEGVDMLVPMLDLTINAAAAGGAHEVLLGMAHRGRLNVLAHIIGRPYESILREFEAEHRVVAGTELPTGGTGDVKYHQGTTGHYETSGGTVAVSLSPNPSHLEAVDPVVVGRTRAEQTLIKGSELHHDMSAAVPILIHGDAAFAGQGIVAETLNLQSLAGYDTGGTIHIISNNQLGFTTQPWDARSTRYASDLAKGFDVPIIHVNADDPEACLAAVQLAMAYRNRFKRDMMIDLIGYRRHGHNETDEPSYTQPAMYAKIKDHRRVREIFADRLIADEIVTAEAVQAMYDERYAHMSEVHDHVLQTDDREASELAEPTGDYIERTPGNEPDTAVAGDTLRSLNERLLQVPTDFTVHPKLQRQLERRTQMPDAAFDWATAESLALGSLVEDGISIRMSGQDTQRGTFAQRHLMLHDVNTGESFAPIQHLGGADATFQLFNSPLSEAACLSFEYGYSVAAPDDLVIWEAQFGDFINGAQVAIDQFVMSSHAKWGSSSRLTLLLPHGYEGNGPEHSNARLDRFLSGAAEGNVRIANCTTSANYFHLLRRQAMTEKRRPLIVMTPKGLLRAPHAMSPLADLEAGRFEWVLGDPRHAGDFDRSSITRLVLCSGKVYYDLANYPELSDSVSTAIARIELLYPFPKKQVKDLLDSYPNLQEVIWTQEEPQNFGSYQYMLQRIPQLLPEQVVWSYAGRPKRSSTSEGYTSVHLLEQERIVRTALHLA